MMKILTLLFGTSWRSSLLGMAGGIVLAAINYAQAQPEPGWYVAAFLLAALSRIIKDSAVTGGTVPATPEAAKRVQS